MWPGTQERSQASAGRASRKASSAYLSARCASSGGSHAPSSAAAAAGVTSVPPPRACRGPGTRAHGTRCARARGDVHERHHSSRPSAGSAAGAASGSAGTPTATAPSGSQSGGRSSTARTTSGAKIVEPTQHDPRPSAGERHQQRLHRGTPRDGEHRVLVRAPSLVRVVVHPVAGAERQHQLRCAAQQVAAAHPAGDLVGGRPSPSRSARHRSAIASSRAVRFARTHTNRNGVLWCGAGAVRATPTARRSAAGSTGASAKSRTLRRSSTASAAPSPVPPRCRGRTGRRRAGG